MREIIAGLLKEPEKDRLESLRREYSRRHGHVPANAEILRACTPAEREVLLPLLMLKPVRSLSGIVVVALMHRARQCPGSCIYCPQGKGAPKSYTGLEPAARRARDNRFDPFLQVRSRLRQLEEIGHPTGKVELIIMGGTFLSEASSFQKKFVKGAFDALNGRKSPTLAKAHILNESASHRCTGLTFETRPDYCRPQHAELALSMGGTRVEVGCQSIYDDVLQSVNRGHPVSETISAIRTLKQKGLKVCLHIMPGLPGSNPARDLEMFRELFSNPDFRPDMLKIYPCLVIRGTQLYKMHKRGEYTPYSTTDVVNLIARASRYFPKYLRIMRIQRDIPVEKIVAGVKKSHLTQLVNQKLAARGESCPCIRCREVGHKKPRSPKWEYNQLEYEASGGTEHFLSYEDRKSDSIASFLRLRLDENARIRELRVCGQALEIGAKSDSATQHKGMGAHLLRKAEEIAAENSYKKISVTSAVGTRPYYRRFGYRKAGPYILKRC